MTTGSYAYDWEKWKFLAHYYCLGVEQCGLTSIKIEVVHTSFLYLAIQLLGYDIDKFTHTSRGHIGTIHGNIVCCFEDLEAT